MEMKCKSCVMIEPVEVHKDSSHMINLNKNVGYRENRYYPQLFTMALSHPGGFLHEGPLFSNAVIFKPTYHSLNWQI